MIASLALAALIAVNELVHLVLRGATLQQPPILPIVWLNARIVASAIGLQENAPVRITLKARHVKECHAPTIALAGEGAFQPRH